MTELDRLERKLLYALDVHAREPFASIAKRLRVPAETLRYRFNRLFERGVISHLLTVIHVGRIGNDYFKILVKLHNVNEASAQKIVSALKDDQDVNWVVRLDSHFDIAFTIRVNRLRSLSDFLDQFKQKYHQYIHRLSFAINIEVEYLPRDYLLDRKGRRVKKRAYYTTPEGEKEGDRVDLDILRFLAVDARRPASDIADKLGYSTESIAQRIRRLENKGIIRRYRVVLNSAALSFENYYVLIYLNSFDPQRVSEMTTFFREHPNVVYFIKALGQWDFELSVEVERIDDYRSFMMELTSRFSDIVQDATGMPVRQLYKFTLAP